MKKFTTLIASLFLVAGGLLAQRVVVNSPSEIAGIYEYGPAGDGATAWGADLTTDVWTGDAEFIDDGTALPTEGCSAAVNDLTGKVALIDRGSCNFSLKALNAQDAGAIAAIIFNNQPGAGVIVLGGGDFAGDVTIPVVMLSYEDGQTIRNALMDGAVNISIGNIRFDNDLSIDATSVIYAPFGTIPASQLGDTTFVVNPGAVITNPGLLSASGVTATATIGYTPLEGGASTEVYNESASLSESLDSDSTSSLVVLPSFQPASGIGVYTLDYAISADTPDDAPADNTLSSTFTLSENLYSKASWDPATGNPRITNAYTISGGADIEFLTVLEIPNSDGIVIDSVVFYVSTALETLAGIPVEAYLYEWDDLSGEGSMSNDEISILGIAPYVFGDDETLDEATLRLPFLDFLTLEEARIPVEEGKRYVVGVRYRGTELVYFGFDETYDYTQYLNYKAADGTLTDVDYGYLGINAWIDEIFPDVEAAFLFSGNRNAVATGVIIGDLTSSTEEVVGEDVFKMNLFPNPTTELLNVTIDFQEQTSFVEYRITDAAGRLLFTNRDNDVFGQEQASFNVKALPNGQYFLTIRTEQGIQASPFMVKH